MLLSLFACSQADTDPIPTAPPPPTEHYVKASKRLSQISAVKQDVVCTVVPTTPAPQVQSKESKNKDKDKKKKLQRASITISSPSGFRHEFHLGRDVESMSELWDLERWRTEIEHRVQAAATEHAAMNHFAAEEAERKLHRVKTTCSIRRKPVPRLVDDPIADLPTLRKDDAINNLSSESLLASSGHNSEIDHDHENENETSSIASSLPPSTPPSRSPRVSSDLKIVDEPLPSIREGETMAEIPNPFRRTEDDEREDEKMLENDPAIGAINELLASYELRDDSHIDTTHQGQMMQKGRIADNEKQRKTTMTALPPTYFRSAQAI